MPEFILNKAPSPSKAHPFYDLDDFAKAYVEAMFFTNGDCGDDRKNILNELGVRRLTRKSCRAIAADCKAFQDANVKLLRQACERDGYDEERAGHDFWYTRQGHGVGYWDRSELDADGLGDALTRAAETHGECDVEVWRGWIHIQP